MRTSSSSATGRRDRSPGRGHQIARPHTPLSSQSVVSLINPQEAAMQQAKRLSICLLALASLLLSGTSPTKAQTTAIFEGGRLITGDGGTPIEDAAFVI